MSAEPKRLRASEELEPILREATRHPLIVEIGDNVYRLNAEQVRPSPYTLESAYASLPPLGGKRGAEISDDELEGMIERAKEDNARDILDGMYETDT